jgi:flagellar biosynthesis protein
MKEPNQREKKAVALRYQPGHDLAPRVIAKGSGEIAEQIIAIAKSNGVPLQENPSLIQLLSKIEVDQQIPPELYRVVAEVLSLVYRIETRAREEYDLRA